MIVQTQSGQVRGTPETGSGYVFRGIPYASPPVGALRWRPPEPVPRWHGIRDAAAFGPMCPQPPAGGLAAQILPSEAESEDCLTCNIWTPGIGAEKYPVAVWIHGGGFIMGSGSWPSGSAFARDGIVLVTFNYRVGPLGFLHLDDLFDDFSGTGNLGIRDQIFLLRWVRDNIAAFGGDPDRVTVSASRRARSASVRSSPHRLPRDCSSRPLPSPVLRIMRGPGKRPPPLRATSATLSA